MCHERENVDVSGNDNRLWSWIEIHDGNRRKDARRKMLVGWRWMKSKDESQKSWALKCEIYHWESNVTAALSPRICVRFSMNMRMKETDIRSSTSPQDLFVLLDYLLYYISHFSHLLLITNLIVHQRCTVIIYVNNFHLHFLFKSILEFEI